MIILGIDPGTTRVGYGVLKKDGNRLEYLDAGLLEIPKGSKQEQLLSLEKSLDKLIEETRPDRIGIERLFFSNNQKTALAVAEARGVILNTVTKRGVRLIELTPPEIKKAVTDDGRASKRAVAKMVGLFVDLGGRKLIDDATDALAIAIAISNRDHEDGPLGGGRG